MASYDRLFHVSKKYAHYANVDPYQILTMVHDELYTNYQKVAQSKKVGGGQGNPAEAMVLQKYLQDLKTVAQELRTGTSGNKLYSGLARNTLVEIIQSSGLKNKALFQQWLGLSGKARGDVFEEELGQIMAGTFNVASGGQFVSDGASYVWGTAKTNIGGLQNADVSNIVKDIGENAVKRAYKVMQQELNKKTQSIAMSELFQQEVNAKIDISGMNCTFNFSLMPKTQLTQIASLLQKATITAKSYASLRQKKDEMKQHLKSQIKSLHLGETNTKRILMDTLTHRVPFDVALSYSIVLSKTQNVDVQLALQKLRFMYELTGAGQNYVQKEFQSWVEDNSALGAKYLVFNDPASMNIYVRSTAELIMEFDQALDEVIEWDNHNQKWATSISKTKVARSF